MTHPFFSDREVPRVLAHRGLVLDEDTWDNTAASFAAAHAAGARYIETDCRVTQDGDPVLIHDETLERLTGDKRPVADVRTRELREIFSEHGGLLTIAEALEAFPGVRFNIDVKSDDAPDAAAAALAKHTDRVLVTSFSDARRLRALDAVRRAGAVQRPATSGGQKTIALLRVLSAVKLSARKVLKDIDAVQIPPAVGPVRVASPGLIRAAHACGTEVHVWTINDPDEMRTLVNSGADGIVTDCADAALELFSTK